MLKKSNHDRLSKGDTIGLPGSLCKLNYHFFFFLWVFLGLISGQKGYLIIMYRRMYGYVLVFLP